MATYDPTEGLTLVTCGECGQGHYLTAGSVLVCTSCRHTIGYADLAPETGTEVVFVQGVAYMQDVDDETVTCVLCGAEGTEAQMEEHMLLHDPDTGEAQG